MLQQLHLHRAPTGRTSFLLAISVAHENLGVLSNHWTNPVWNVLCTG
jgi:hypothetical protein